MRYYYEQKKKNNTYNWVIAGLIFLVFFVVAVAVMDVPKTGSDITTHIKTQPAPKTESDADKIIGTWNYKTKYFDMTYTFNKDGTGMSTNDVSGDTTFDYKLIGGVIILTDIQGGNVPTILKDRFGNIKKIPYNFIDDKSVVLEIDGYERMFKKQFALW